MPVNNAAITFLSGLATGVVAALGFTYLQRNIKPTFGQQERSHGSSPTNDAITKLEQQFTVSSRQLASIVKHFIAELRKGLEKEGQTLKMIPSFVTKLPNGTETGTFLALDLGGSNFRVCEITLEGAGRYRMRQSKHTISENVKTGDAVGLFGFIADCIAQFVEEHAIDTTDTLRLGFTFSFPVNQTALNAGSLLYWNKGFTCKNVVGHDVVDLLQHALKDKNLNIEVTALVNDTVGTLVSHAYVDPQTTIGVILGTGTNAAYLEDIKNIPKFHGTTASGKMIINCEWGNFDSQRLVLPVTEYDLQIDRATSNPGIQIFEKMISGMYLGEIVRLVINNLMKSGDLFHSCKVDPFTVLNKTHGFQTAFMSRVERDHSLDLNDVKTLLEGTLGVVGSSLEDRRVLKRVCELVGLRAARLSAAGIAALLTITNTLSSTTVAIDGSLFEHYPHFKNRMRDALRELIGLNEENIVIDLARDGSGVGAALIAAVEGSD